MTVTLDPELKALMSEDQTVTVLWQDTKGHTALLAKADNQEVESFRGKVPIKLRWELRRFPCGSVLRLHISIFDQPNTPYVFETFINVEASEQLTCVNQLLDQETLQFHFFDSQTEYVFTKEIPYLTQQRRELGQLITQALQDVENLGEVWDFDQAKALFQASYPL